MESTYEAPAFTVVIPSHAVSAEHLRDAIDSVRNQSFGNWEGVVVDDGGLDFSTVDMISSIGDSRVRVVKHPENRGLGAARNTGFKAARAPLVAMLDADDRLHSDYLRVMADTFPEPPTKAWGWPDIELFGSRTGQWRFPDSPETPCPAHLNYRGGSSLIPTSLWSAVGGFVEDPLLAGLEDLDFWLGALEVGAVPVYVHELLYQWRISPNSMTFTVSPDNHLQMEEIYNRRRDVFDVAPGCLECTAKPGSVFRARGYFNASVHARRSGHKTRSLSLGLRGSLINPRDMSLRRHLTSLATPKRLARLIDGSV